MNKQRIRIFLIAVISILSTLLPAVQLSAQKIEGGKLISWVGASGDITIPDGVTEIAAQCFYSFSSDPDNPWDGVAESNTEITSVNFNAVKIIGKEAFKGCTGIQSIVSPQISHIGQEAFDGCSALKAITLPQIIQIDNAAFANCSALTTASLGKTLTTIGANPFVNNTALASLSMESGATSFLSESNALIRISDGTLISLAGAAQSITIGESCKAIGQLAMKDCRQLSKIDLPYAKTIGDKALTNCYRLSELLVPRLESVDNSSYITFNGVGSLQIIDVHLNPTFAGFSEALSDRSEMKVYVANEAVKTKLRSELKQAQIIVGSPTAVQEVTVSYSHNEGGTIEAWLPGAIDLSSGQKVPAGTTVSFKAIPRFDNEIESWTLNGKPITSGITDNTYRIESIQEDATLTVSFRKKPDGYYIFFKSRNPEFGSLSCRVKDGDEIKYGDKVNRNATLIFTATPRKGYRVTDWYQDKGVGTAIEFVKIDGLTGQTTYTCAAEDGLDIRADFDCKPNHHIVRYRSLNTNNASISAASADGTAIEPSEAVPAGTKLTFTAHPTAGMSVAGWYNNNEEISGEKNLTYTIQSLSADLTIAVLCMPNTTPTPGKYDPVIKNGHLISWKPQGAAVLPDEVTHIDAKAFEGANEMTALTLNKAVKYIGELAFLYAAELKTISVPADNPTFQAIDGILYSKDGSTLIVYPGGREGVTFTIPTTVSSIRPGAFVSTPHLQGLTVASGHNTLEARDGALYTKGLTTLLYFPNGFNPKPQKEVTLPQGLKEIGRLAVAYIPTLSKLHLPASLTSIAPMGLVYNPSLEMIDISTDPSLASIGDSAFYYSRSLKTLPHIPSLRSIGIATFAIASSLVEIHIPAACAIGDKAFSNCEALKVIYAYDPQPAQITEATFAGIAFVDECKLFVPKGARAAYTQATGWKAFAKNIVEVEGMSSTNISAHQNIRIYKEGTATIIDGIASGTPYSIYHSSGILCLRGISDGRVICRTDLPSGLYIIQISGLQPIKFMH